MIRINKINQEHIILPTKTTKQTTVLRIINFRLIICIMFFFEDSKTDRKFSIEHFANNRLTLLYLF